MLILRRPRSFRSAAVGAALFLSTPLVQAEPASKARPVTKAQCGAAYEKAQELKAKAKLAAAQRQLRICVQTECPGFIQKDCASWSSEVSQTIPSFLIVVTGSDGSDISQFSAKLDGEPLSGVDGMIEVDPGDHELVVSHQGLPDATKQLHFEAGDQRKLVKVVFELPRESGAGDLPREAGTREPGADQRDLTWPIISLGIGAVGLGVGGFFLLRSAANRDDADALYAECQRDSGCLNADPRSDQISQFDDDARSAQVFGIVGLAIGGVAVATGVTLFVLEGDDHESSVRAYLAPTGGGLSGRF
ncbi:MAG: hypothetical protein R3B89_21220 [Polyangiaceae bacterium]